MTYQIVETDRGLVNTTTDMFKMISYYLSRILDKKNRNYIVKTTPYLYTVSLLGERTIHNYLIDIKFISNVQGSTSGLLLFKNHLTSQKIIFDFTQELHFERKS